MRLGLTLGYWSPEGPGDQLALAIEADRLGYAVVWAAEAYGSDAVSVLAYVGARTQRIGLGAAVLQIPARAPAMTAMTAATLDLLSGGRFHLGLGVSGPQVSEGWYGVPFARPLQRTQAYVRTVRQVLRREPVALGESKPLRLAIRPLRADVPIYLAAVGPKNLALAGEIADGWLGVFAAPDQLGETLARLGERRTGGLEGFDTVATVPVVLGDDVAACARAVRSYAALYIGGMGSREHNFYNALARRMGYEREAALVQEHFLAGRYREAAAAVPFEFVDRTSLLGPPERVEARLAAYASAGLSTLSVLPLALDPVVRLETLRTLADLTSTSPAGPAETGTSGDRPTGAGE